MRKVELQQLNRALPHIIKSFGFQEENIPIFLGGDFNDCSNFKCYNSSKNELTPFYHYLTVEDNWTNLFSEDCGPTTLTLSREYCIDYIFAKKSDKYTVKAMPREIRKVYLGGFDENGNKILVTDGDKSKIALGLPLCAIDNQPIIPSDHLPIIADISISFE